MKELTKLFTFLEKYSINFNEYMLAKMLAWAQTKQNAEVVSEYFSMRVCCRDFTIQLLQGLKVQEWLMNHTKFQRQEVSLNLAVSP